MAIPIDCSLAASKKNSLNPWSWMGKDFKLKRAKFEADVRKCKACKEMLLGQLAGMPYALRAAATHVCINDEVPKSGCDYLENFNAGGDQMTIQKYGIDCNTSTGVGSQKLKQQIADQAAQSMQQQNNLYIGIGVFLVALIIVVAIIFTSKSKKNGSANAGK